MPERGPIKDLLRDPTPGPATVDRMWAAVQRAGERRRRRRTAIAASGLVLAPAIVLLAIAWRGGRAPGPLRLEGGAALAVLEPPPGAPREVTLDDGSRLALGAGARLETLDNDGGRFDAALRRGTVDFTVVPGGRRRWVIEAGAVTVEVIGTRFAVERAPDHVEVRVSEGVVLVRGDRVPGRVQRLVAGDVIRIDEPAATRAPAPPPPPPTEAGPGPREAPVSPAGSREPNRRAHGTRLPQPPPPIPDASAPSSPPPPPPPPPAPGWKELAEQRRFTDAWSALGAGGPAAVARGLDDPDALLLLADVARLSGHATEAATVLEALGARFPSDPRAALGAFTLGRIAFDDLDDPARAATAFSRALAIGLPRALAEDAWARLVEAQLRRGDRAAAEAAAREYAERFPGGRYRERVRRWLEAR